MALRASAPSWRFYLGIQFGKKNGILGCIQSYLGNPWAYATLVMNGERYVAGAAVLGRRLRQLRQVSYIPSYCLVTPDVTEAARQVLRQCFDYVVQVPYIRATTRHLLTSRQERLYGSWISASFTKWNVFHPRLYIGKDGIPEKVLLLDSDLLPRTNLDHLFELSTPAACFSNCWSTRYSGRNGIPELYEKDRLLRHGERIVSTLVTQSLNPNPRDSAFCVNAVAVLLQPKEHVFNEMLRILRDHQVKRIPYGFPGVYSGFDEQMLCSLMLYLEEKEQCPITHLSPGYIWNAGKYNWVPEKERRIIHYYGEKKPWMVPRHQQFPDTAEWWEVALLLQRECPRFCDYLPKA